MVDFSNTELAFKRKDNKSLKRAYRFYYFLNKERLSAFLAKLLIIFLKVNIPVIRGYVKREFFSLFCGGETLEETLNQVNALGNFGVKSVLDFSVEGKETEKEFDRSCDEILRGIALAKENPNLPFVVFKLTGLGRYRLIKLVNFKVKLNDQEIAEFNRVRARVDRLARAAYDANIRLLIDAEESWLQNTIDDLVLEMMKKYNRQKVTIYNTAQMYRWDRVTYLKQLNINSEREGYYVGIKLVRGAYMEKENSRAQRKGYDSPIQKTKNKTDRDFNTALGICMDNIDRFSLFCGTHNEESTNYLMKLMAEKGLRNSDKRIYFSQLLGMSDHLTFNLSSAGYNVCKYVPYGPIKEMIPYLIRRAEENTAVNGQFSRELEILKKELKRRAK